MKNFRFLCLLGPYLLSSTVSNAELKLASVFGNNMVLQREKPVPVWGWAKPGDTVTVEFAGQSVAGTAGEGGRWKATLAALEASADPKKLTVRAKSGGAAVTINNVLVGEVWLCSGQSNMEWSVKASKNPQGEIAEAQYPAIRLFHVPRVAATVPQDSVKAEWRECAPGSVTNFSAVGYFFGRELHGELRIPIGLIASAWGGTRIEPWTPTVGLASVGATKPLAEQYGDAEGKLQDKLKGHIAELETWIFEARKASSEGRKLVVPPRAPELPKYNHGTPTGLYNGMIHALAPFSLRGAIWYQGESNNGEGMLYFEKMKALVGGWRSVFDNPDLSFYFVQLAPFKYGNGQNTLPYIWEAQTASALKIPNTGMVVTTDIGNVQDIHPRNKQDVGKRLALWALAKNYGRPKIAHSGPIYRSMKSEGGAIRIEFDHTSGGLKSRDGKELTDFQIAGEDGKFVPAQAKIDGVTVLVSSPDVPAPTHVRFGWHHMINPNLSNGAGLPASPFKTDKWLEGK